MIKIELPGKPVSTNQIYRSGRGNYYMNKKGKAKKDEYVWKIRKQYKGEVIEDHVLVEIHLYFTDKRRRDVDNYLKLILDAIEGEIYKDDSQIKRLTIRKHLDQEEAKAEVSVGGMDTILNNKKQNE